MDQVIAAAAPQEDNNKDEHLTEQEALERAEAEGTPQITEYAIVKKVNPINQIDPTNYSTRPEAEAALEKRADADECMVVERRRQATEADNV